MSTEPHVPLVDLKKLHAGHRENLLAALARVIDSGRFILGEEVSSFEAEVAKWLGVEHAMGVSNGTDALSIALLALGVQPGDRVLTSALSFAATASAIVRVGAVPVFCDVEEETFNIDPELIDAPTLEGVTAAIVVHLFGRAADTRALKRRLGDVPLVEDAAQAFGAWSDEGSVGGLGQLAAFSFFPAKPLGALGDAGLVVSNDAELAERCRALRAHGRGQDGSYHLRGTNMRLDELQAAVLRLQLPDVRGRMNTRGEHARLYDQRLSDLEGLTLPRSCDGHAWSVYTLLVDHERDGLAEHLRGSGVECAVYYRRPLPFEPAFAQHTAHDAFPVARSLCDRVLSVPIAAELGPAGPSRVCDVIRSYYGRQ